MLGAIGITASAVAVGEQLPADPGFLAEEGVGMALGSEPGHGDTLGLGQHLPDDLGEVAELVWVPVGHPAAERP